MSVRVEVSLVLYDLLVDMVARNILPVGTSSHTDRSAELLVVSRVVARAHSLFVALANVDVESRVDVLVLRVGTGWCGDSVAQLVVVRLICAYLVHSVEERYALLLD